MTKRVKGPRLELEGLSPMDNLYSHHDIREVYYGIIFALLFAVIVYAALLAVPDLGFLISILLWILGAIWGGEFQRWRMMCHINQQDFLMSAQGQKGAGKPVNREQHGLMFLNPDGTLVDDDNGDNDDNDNSDNNSSNQKEAGVDFEPVQKLNRKRTLKELSDDAIAKSQSRPLTQPPR